MRPAAPGAGYLECQSIICVCKPVHTNIRKRPSIGLGVQGLHAAAVFFLREALAGIGDVLFCYEEEGMLLGANLVGGEVSTLRRGKWGFLHRSGCCDGQANRETADV